MYLMIKQTYSKQILYTVHELCRLQYVKDYVFEYTHFFPYWQYFVIREHLSSRKQSQNAHTTI